MKHYIYYVILLLNILCPKLAFAQVDSIKSSNSLLISTYININQILNSYDTAYIKHIPHKYVLIAKSSNRLDSYNIEVENKATIDLQSDLDYNVEFSFGYKSVLLSYSINVTETLSKKSFVNNEWDFRLNGNTIYLGIFYTKNRSQTNISKYEDVHITQNMNQSFDGLHMSVFGGDAYYFFNHSRYSNSAAYSNNHTKIQSKSVGSFIGGMSYFKQKIFLDFTKLSQEIEHDILSKIKNQTINYSNYSLCIGYAYNYVFAEKWLANIMLIPSVGTKIYQENNTTKSVHKHLSINNKIKIALVYNMPQYFGGINCEYNTNRFYTNNYLLINSRGIFNLFLGRTF